MYLTPDELPINAIVANEKNKKGRDVPWIFFFKENLGFIGALGSPE